jgi:prepilin signal peptidase PulO-like enzyme (type II secretory pathway)
MHLVLILFAVLGLLLGSFGNMALYRIKARRGFGGRSFCPYCHHTIAAYDLIPVLSFVLLGGRCRHCRKSISIGYPLIELLSACAFVLPLILMRGDTVGAFLLGIALVSMLLLSVYDAMHQQIPDLFTIVIVIVATVLVALGYTEWKDALLGTTAALIWFGALLLVSRGKAVGAGDLFLSGALGALLGFIGSITMLVISYIVGAVTILFLLATKRITHVHHQRIAFGPFLVIGALLALLGAGEWYIRLLGL